MKNKIQFEAFESINSRTGDKPVISLLAKRGFGFGTVFINKLIPHRPKFVALRYAQDLENIYIGFSFSDEKKKIKGSLKIFYVKENYGIIQPTSYFKKYGIDSKKYKAKYGVEEYADDKLGKIFVITLRKNE